MNKTWPLLSREADLTWENHIIGSKSVVTEVRRESWERDRWSDRLGRLNSVLKVWVKSPSLSLPTDAGFQQEWVNCVSSPCQISRKNLPSGC